MRTFIIFIFVSIPALLIAQKENTLFIQNALTITSVKSHRDLPFHTNVFVAANNNNNNEFLNLNSRAMLLSTEKRLQNNLDNMRYKNDELLKEIALLKQQLANSQISLLLHQNELRLRVDKLMSKDVIVGDVFDY